MSNENENDDTGSTHDNDDQSLWDQRSTGPSVADRSSAPSMSEQVTNFQAKRASASTRVPGVGAFSMGSFFYTPTPPPGADAAPAPTAAIQEEGDEEEAMSIQPGPRVNLHRAEAPRAQAMEDDYSVYNNSIAFNSSVNMNASMIVDERSHTFLSADMLNTAHGGRSPGLVGQDQPDSNRSNVTDDNAPGFYEPMRLKSTVKNLALGFCLLLLIISAIVTFAVNVREKKPGLTLSPTVTPVVVKAHHCDLEKGVLSNPAALIRTERYLQLKLVLQAALREQGDRFDDLCTSHDLALTWLADHDGLEVDPSETAQVHQRFATAQFYYSTQIPVIVLKPSTKLTPFNWLLNLPECQWSGITCNSESAITEIQVESTGLRGTIPNELAFLLPSLSTLDLSKNDFTGTLPLSLYSAPKLRYLNLAYNKLRGPIDQVPWTTLDLERMVLDKNAFSGTIPQSFVNMTKLMDMNLCSNRFSGPIPDKVFIGLTMKILRISQNDLTGTLPAYLSRSLEFLELKRNDIQGEIPSTIFNLRRLVVLDLSDNKLNGTLSENIGNMIELEGVLLFGNKLSGTIPRTIAFLSGLEAISLAGNRFTGTLPTHIGEMTQLVKLSLTENTLTGTLPTELGNLANLAALEIHSNFLSQTIPTEIGNMKNLALLDATGNMLSGGVPPEVCQLRQGDLQALSVDCVFRLTCPESCCTLCL